MSKLQVECFQVCYGTSEVTSVGLDPPFSDASRMGVVGVGIVGVVGPTDLERSVLCFGGRRKEAMKERNE